MYQKMQLKGRQTFRRGVVKLLESVPQSDYTNRMATRKLYVVLDLAYVSEAGEDPTFCASLFEAIDSLVADHEALEQAFDELDDEDEDLYEATSDLGNNQQEISGGIFLLLQLAARIPAKTLGSYENRIHELYNRIEFNFKEDVVYLLSKITLREDARGELDQLLKKVINTLPSYTKISSVKNLFDQEVTPEDYESFPDVLIELVHKAFLFCRSFGEWQSDDVQLVLDTSRVFSDRFMNPSFFEKDGERALLSMTLLECLADLPDDVNVLDSMHDLFFRAQLAGTDCGVDFQDKLTYWKRLDGLVTALRSNSSLLGSSLLAYLLHFVQPGHLAMARYRSDYREVAERLILDNASRLAAPVGAAIESEVAEVVENLLVAPVFEFDRNISLDLVMSYSDNLGALRLRLMMELLERRSAIYEPRYLGFLREFLVTPGNEIEVAEFLEWDGLYTHTSNIPFLRDAFQYLITGSEVDRTIFDQSSVFLLMGVSRFTMLVSRSEEWRIEDVIEVLQGVLVAPEVVDVLSEDQQLEIMRAEDLIGYPLAFQATGDSQFAVDYDYPHFRTEVPAEATRLLNLLCLYLIPLATAEQLARVKIVSQGMPRGLYDDFEDYAQRFHLQKERFSEEEFERLGQ
jgi:hypothetical protein